MNLPKEKPDEHSLSTTAVGRYGTIVRTVVGVGEERPLSHSLKQTVLDTWDVLIYIARCAHCEIFI